METRNTLRNLVAWQKAVALHADLIRLSLQPQVARHPWLAEKLREGGHAVSGCVAEAQGRADRIDRGHGFGYAKGEAARFLSLLAAARQAGLIEGSASEALERRCEELQGMLGAARRQCGRDPEWPLSDGSPGPSRRRPPSDGESRAGDPWDSRS